MQEIVDITGNEYGRLLVIGFDHIGARRRSYWKCRCECGKEIVLRKDSFAYKYSRQKSCGCWHREESKIRANANRNAVTGRIEKK